jgi:hypothetical protein
MTWAKTETLPETDVASGGVARERFRIMTFLSPLTGRKGH